MTVDDDGAEGAGAARELELDVRRADRQPGVRGRRRRLGRRPRADAGGDIACTQIFGGPEEATIKGTIRGEPVDATFTRTDGCEIARWDASRRCWPRCS